ASPRSELNARTKGTYLDSSSSWCPPRQWISKKLDYCFAWYLDTHVMGGYRFLMENYQEGDYVGLLPKSNEEQVAFAYEKYLDDTSQGKKAARAFKRTFSTSVPIEFIGVWDTVASVGWTFKHLPFDDSNTITHRFRHALALDERRMKFRPSLWHMNHPTNLIGYPLENGTNDDSEYHHGQATDVQEVWFAGCHADVGGGSTPNTENHTLANPSLQWMISEVIKHCPYVLFKPEAFASNKAFSTRSRKLTGIRNLRTEPERDANAELHDQLVKNPMWHLLEYIPTSQPHGCKSGLLNYLFRLNPRPPRMVYDSNPKFHESVKLRKNYEGKWKTMFIPKPGQQVKIEYVK
ncbi:hypothetical protein FRC01_011483, partial [Tulasnella sp. 417]